MRRYLFDGKPGVDAIVQSCNLLEIFELIITDEIVNHIVTYSNLYANQSIGNKEFKKFSDYVTGRRLLLLKSDCVLPH